MDKRQFVLRSFAAIAGSYDLVNTLLSFGADVWWRREAIKALGLAGKEFVLDCCAGTLRLSKGILRRRPQAQVIALDFSLVMLARGMKRTHTAALSPVGGDAERLPFRAETFDRIIVGFGIRNLVHPQTGIKELFRVIKQGGRLVILEFGRPTLPVFKEVYRWYLSRFIPWSGGLVSGHKEVYDYLHTSIMAFSAPAELIAMMRKAGFSHVSYRKLTVGIVNLYTGEKA
jgi:demethylmenaquinone methyltransferase/2-methoxy-6-polyprenyl-1,4-benzoquinol methylase